MNSCVVKIDFFIFTVVSAQSDNITLIRRDKNQLVLTETSQKSGVRLGRFVTRFDRKCDMLVFSEIKADDWVARERYSPVRQGYIGAPGSAEVKMSGHPSNSRTRFQCDSHNCEDCES